MKSILFSLYQHFRTLSLGVALSSVFNAAIGIVRALFSRFISRSSEAVRETAWLRTWTCEKCDFYDSKWKTCGTPGDVMEENGVRLKIGCWCYLPISNLDPSKDCYARANDIIGQHGEKVGWPDALRP